MTRKSPKLEPTDDLSSEEIAEDPIDNLKEDETPTPPLVVEQGTPKPVEPVEPPTLAPKPKRVPPVVRAQQRNVPRFSQTR